MTRKQAWVLAWTSLGSFMVVLDLLVVATALTAIRRDLGASLKELESVVNAYTLSFAVLIMTAAALGDRFGRRRLYAGGLGLFALASAGCALAPSAGALIAARAVQGAGAATVMPLALALLNAAFSARFVALLSEDAVLSMPPWRLWYAGGEAIGVFFTRVNAPAGHGPPPFRLGVPTAANRQRAGAMYMRRPDGGFQAHAIHLLTLQGGAISGLTVFRDPRLFTAFGLPDVR